MQGKNQELFRRTMCQIREIKGSCSAHWKLRHQLYFPPIYTFARGTPAYRFSQMVKKKRTKTPWNLEGQSMSTLPGQVAMHPSMKDTHCRNQHSNAFSLAMLVSVEGISARQDAFTVRNLLPVNVCPLGCYVVCTYYLVWLIWFKFSMIYANCRLCCWWCTKQSTMFILCMSSSSFCLVSLQSLLIVEKVSGK